MCKMYRGIPLNDACKILWGRDVADAVFNTYFKLFITRNSHTCRSRSYTAGRRKLFNNDETYRI